MIVVDASAILEVLLKTPAGARVAERLFIPGETLHAPHLRREGQCGWETAEGASSPAC